MVKKIPIAVLGATGLVGEKACDLIERSDRFQLTEVAASENHIGKNIRGLKAKRVFDIESPYILSALPAQVATEIEPLLLQRGQHIFSNASSFRMKEDVPLLIPEVNLSHLSLIERQTTPGKLICTPNCVVAFVAPALLPLMEVGTITHINLSTMQALSGAGKNYSLKDTLIPNIEGEEEKIPREIKKILGLSPPFSVHTHRIPIPHGHSALLHVHFKEPIDKEEVKKRYTKKRDLYSLYEDPFSPQPDRDIGPFDTKVHIGRIKQTENVISMIVMGHNLVRGAAYGCLLNATAFLENL